MLYTLFCLGVLGVFSLHMLLLCLVNHSRTADTADKPTDAMHTELSDYSRTYIGGYNSALRSRSLKGWPTEKTYLDDRFNAHSIFIAIVEQTRIHTQGGAANFDHLYPLGTHAQTHIQTRAPVILNAMLTVCNISTISMPLSGYTTRPFVSSLSHYQSWNMFENEWSDFCRAMLYKRGLCRHAVPVRRSCSWILSKRINIFSIFFHGRVATPFWFYGTKRHSNISTGTALTGASNTGGEGTNRTSGWKAGYRSMTSAVRTTTATVHRTVYRTDSHASVNLCLSQPAWTTTTNRREQNRIYLYAAVNLKRNLRSTYCTIEVTAVTKHRAASLCDSRATCDQLWSQEVKGQGHMLDLEAWRRHHSGPSWVE